MNRKIFWLVSVVLLWTISALSLEPLQAQFYIPLWDKNLWDFADDSVMFQDGNGNIGIGTTSPLAKLHVNGKSLFSGATGVDPVIHASNTSFNSFSIVGEAPNGTVGAGVAGKSTNGYGVYATSTSNRAVFGVSDSDIGVAGGSNGSNGTGVLGRGYTGVWGESPWLGGIGVLGVANSGGLAYGVWGRSTSGTGVVGTSSSGLGAGVSGSNSGSSPIAAGVVGAGYNGVSGSSPQVNGNGVVGEANNGAAAYGVWGKSASGYAGYFSGRGYFSGFLEKPGGGFKIDHPLDPDHKYLNHFFVESPDMKNVYDGVVVLDAHGEAWVTLPQYFEALNRDFRYQLTSIGGFSPAYIAEEIAGHRFKIAGGQPGGKISWQVTGIRQDAWAQSQNIPVEEMKSKVEKGFYLHPELFGQPPEKSREAAKLTGSRSQ